jgi:hypothetical protein
MPTSKVEVVLGAVVSIAMYATSVEAQRPLTPLPAEGQDAINGKSPTVRQPALNGAARVSVGLDQNSWRELQLRISVENLTVDLLGAHDIGLAMLDGDRHTISPAPNEELERRVERSLAVPPPGSPPTGYSVDSHSTTSGDISTYTTGHASITPDLFSRLYWARTARRYRQAQETARLTENNLAELKKRQGDWERPLVRGEIRDGEFWYVPSKSANLSAVTVVLVLRDPASGKADLLNFRFQGLQPRR